MITDSKIKSFLLLADELNFSRAAQRLYVSQQALSAQIASLELDLGFPLFIRTTKSVRLTEGGRVMAEFLRRAMEEYQYVTAPFRQNTRRHLKVGCFENLDFGSLLFRARDSLFDLYPEISLQLHAYPNYSDLFRRLEEHVIDLAIMPLGMKIPAHFASKTVTHDETFAFISRKFPNWNQVHTLMDLKDSVIFAGPENNVIWKYLQDYFTEWGSRPKLQHEPEMSVNLERMIVEAGEAVGIGGRYSLLFRAPGLHRIPIAIEGIIGAVWRREDSTPELRSFLQALSNLIDQLQVI